MISESAYMLYQKWCDTEEYRKQSCIENSSYERHTGEIKNIVGEDNFRELEEFVCDLCSEVEQAGFEAGIRQGILFYQEIMKGSVA